MSVSAVSIPLSERFDAPSGALTNYEAYDTAQRTAINAQRHRDIRCFVDESITVASNMFNMDTGTMDYFDGLTMDEIVETIEVYSENWSLGTLAPQADRNYWNGISINVPIGTAVSTSVGPTVDLSAFNPADTISLAFADLPTDLTRAASFVDFTSHPSGDFTVGPTVTLPFTGLASGDVELSTPLSSLVSLGYMITAVRFRLEATSAVTFRCLAIRCLASTWVYASVDTNTLLGRLVRPVSRTGAAGAAVAFPANVFVDPQVPTDWPILFRSDTPSGSDDPRPIDVSEAVVFNTGQKIDGEFRLYFREYAYDLVTQLDLDSGPMTQAELEAIGHQLDYDRALYRARDQDDLDTLPQGTLDGALQIDLEAEPDYFTASWVEVDLSWTSSTAALVIQDTEGNDYTFEVTLAANTRYVLLTDIRGGGVRARIYPINSIDQIDHDNIVFDSSLIQDTSVFIRRAGRVGWYARFDDGNSSLDSLRYSGANFAEYRSAPLRSLTPVDGGQVFYGGSGHREGVTGVSETGSATVTPDTSKSASGVCYRVDIDGETAFSGLTTNEVLIENFDTASVSFSLYVSSDTSNAGARMLVYLTDAWDRMHLLNIGRMQIDRWQRYDLDLSPLQGQVLPGQFALHVAVLHADLRVTFYVDAPSVRQQSLAWSGRADSVDPWGDHGITWIPFREAINSKTAGVVFASHGTSPQVRAQARYQDAFLTKVSFAPRFAALGRLIWAEDHVSTQEPIISGFDAAVSGLNVTLSVDPADIILGDSNWVAYHEWSLGDGTMAAGSEVGHQYAEAGTYNVSLAISDNQGSRAISIGTVTVP